MRLFQPSLHYLTGVVVLYQPSTHSAEAHTASKMDKEYDSDVGNKCNDGKQQQETKTAN